MLVCQRVPEKYGWAMAPPKKSWQIAMALFRLWRYISL